MLVISRDRLSVAMAVKGYKRFILSKSMFHKIGVDLGIVVDKSRRDRLLISIDKLENNLKVKGQGFNKKVKG
jgi:hypothetical protein